MATPRMPSLVLSELLVEEGVEPILRFRWGNIGAVLQRIVRRCESK